MGKAAGGGDASARRGDASAESALVERRARVVRTFVASLARGDSYGTALDRVALELARLLPGATVVQGDIDTDARLHVRTEFSERVPRARGVALELAAAPQALSALQHGRVVVAADASEHDALAGLGPSLRAAGFHALLIAPIESSDGNGAKSDGVLCAHARAPREWSAAEVDCVQEIAHVFGLAARAQRALDARDKARSENFESETRFRQIAETVRSVLWITELQPERVVYVNSAFERIWGVSPERLYRDSRVWMQAVHPDDRQRVAECFERFTHGAPGAEFKVEYRIVRPDGGVRWIYDTGARVFNDQRIAGRLAGVAEDITERKQAERALAEKEALLSAIIDHAPFDLWACDSEGRYILQNPESVRRIGNRIGRRPREIGLPRELSDKWRERDLRVLAGERVTVEARDELQGGDSWSYKVLAPIRHGDEVRGFLGVNLDITQQKRAQSELQASREHFRELVEGLREVVFQCDFDARLTFLNRAWHVLTGHEPDSTLHESLLEHLHADDRACALEHVRRVARDRDAEARFDARIATRARTYRWVEVVLRARVAERRAYVQGALIDIDDRVRAEHELRESQRRVATLLSNLPGYAYRARADDATTLEFISDGVREITGYRADEFFGPDGVRFAELIHPDDLPDVERLSREALRACKPFEHTYRLRSRDGAWRWVWERGRGVPGSAGDVTHVEGFVTDISARKHLEGELLRAQKLEAVGRLAGGVAHDFNNILTGVLGYTDLCRTHAGTPREVCEHLEMIRAYTMRAGDLTHQLLAFARRQVVAPRIVDLDELLEHGSGLLARLCGPRVHVSIRKHGRLWPVRADPSQLLQVLMNLVVNARDALPNGGELEIETSAYEGAVAGGDAEQREWLRLRVTDNGLGMSEDVRLRAFEPFFSTKADGRGTGLGLATTHGIVSQAGGHIELESALGRGTTFTIFLPRCHGDAESLAEPVARVGSLVGAETILLVEDEPHLRELGEQSLAALGYTVYSAADAEQALRWLESTEQRPDLLITDVLLPRRGGTELAAELVERIGGLRVLYVSGQAETEAVLRGIARGGAAFLGKPFTPTQLATRVRELLDG